MTPAEIRKLLPLAEQGKSRDLALYAKWMQALERIAAEQAALEQKSRSFAQVDGQDFGATARWQNWAQQQTRRLLVEAQQATVEKEACRKQAVTSAARVQALELLLQQARAAELLQHRRRAEQNGVPPDA